MTNRGKLESGMREEPNKFQNGNQTVREAKIPDKVRYKEMKAIGSNFGSL